MMSLLKNAGLTLAVLGLASVAHAGPTKSFVLDSQSSLNEGKLDGTAIESDGTIRAGVLTRRTELPGVPTAKSLLTLPDGTAYVGTGNDGKIYAVKDGVAKVFAETKQVMVSSLTRDAAGTLYAGTLPSGKIFAINSQGNVRELVQPPGAEHVWALAYDDAKKTLFAATGPEGKLFAIDSNNKAEVYYDSEDDHIMALQRADDGALYLGTSDRALLVRLRGAGRAEVLYDFEGSEVTAIALRGKRLAVVANQFPKTLKPNSKPAPSPNAQPSPASPAPAAAPSAPPAGKGQLFHVSAQAEVELLYSADEGHLAAVAWADDDSVYVGTGKEGHIHRVRVSDHEHSLLVDVDERQIQALQLTASTPTFITADGAAVYAVNSSTGKREWTSKALDAGTRARFGALYTRARGPVSISTRSGNTDKPDASWSDWAAPLAAAGAAANPGVSSAQIQSPPARFVQVRASLSQIDSVVYALEAYYLPDNRAPLVTEVSVEPPKAATPANNKDDKSKAGPSNAGTQYKLHWKVDNPDSDSVRYRVAVRRESAQQYRSLLRDSDVLTATDYSWETDAVPDGYYRVRVEASDELDNPAALARTTRGESEPFLVDNRAPEIVDLRLQGAKVVGRAFDEQGPITRLEYSFDGFEWRVLRAEDDLLDAREEAFSLQLPQLSKGLHLLSVRASDARSNSITRELELSVP
jgi:outer membrane protein assembly factor BamB